MYIHYTYYTSAREFQNIYYLKDERTDGRTRRFLLFFFFLISRVALLEKKTGGKGVKKTRHCGARVLFLRACVVHRGRSWPRTATHRPPEGFVHVNIPGGGGGIREFRRRVYRAVGRHVVVRVAAFFVPSRSLNHSTSSPSRRTSRPLTERHMHTRPRSPRDVCARNFHLCVPRA